MKELSIEEKAKRYDEAINKANSKIKNDKNHVLYEDDIIEIFPELKDGDDEKIRKELLDYCKNKFKKYHNDPKFSAWITWLEKQGEKDKEITILKDQIESLHAAIKALKEVHKIKLKKQGDQILANSAKTCKDEQKPAWSEEDKIYISDVIWCIEQARKVAKDENDMGTTWCAERWVKSLKDKLQLK